MAKKIPCHFLLRGINEEKKTGDKLLFDFPALLTPTFFTSKNIVVRHTKAGLLA
ncbi:MAG: hypothetical protein HZA77_13950 [Candidatus Schekmanbacteria bacterium]|nr:hypothetical protein [Candidatus Schekmanbacteria bacterium]